MFQRLYAQAYKYFLQQDIPETLSIDFQKTLERTDKTREDSIILTAKKYVGHFEAETNAKVYSSIYEVPLAEMQEALASIATELPSLKRLLQDENQQKYLSHIYRLIFAMRWNMRQRFYPISVMSHKVIVAYMSYVIAMIGNEHGEQNDVLETMFRAIYHDVPEVITGDIVTPTKKAIP